MHLPQASHQQSGGQQQQDHAPVKRRWLRWAATSVLVAVGAWWLWREGYFAGAGSLLLNAHRGPVILAGILVIFSLLAKSVRWRSLLPRGELSTFEAYRVFHVAILLNNLLPLRAGDGTRVLSGPVRRIATVQQAVLALAAERVLDAALLTGVALVAFPLLASSRGGNVDLGRLLPFDLSEALLVIASTTGVLAVVGAAIVLGRARRMPWLRALLADGRLLLGGGRGHAARMLGWTGTAWVAVFALHYVLLGAVGAPQSVLLAVIVTVMTNLAMLVPATPASIGTFHAAAVTPLLAMGASREVAVAYALLAHVVNSVPPTVIGLSCLAWVGLPRRPRRQRGA